MEYNSKLKEIRCPHDCSGKSNKGRLLFKCSDDASGEYEDKCSGKKKCIISYKNKKLTLTPTVANQI